MVGEKHGRLAAVFRAVFELPPEADVTGVEQGTFPAWDSMAHVTLVAALESEFGLVIDAGDSLDLTSYVAVAAYLEEQGA